MNKKKDTQLAANLSKYESHKMLKQQLMNDQESTAKLKNVDYESIIAKSKKMTMENYIGYKKQIFLSVMRQNDIQDNIKDMNNLITEAHEELESNLQKTKQSMLDANKLVKDSRQEYDRVKQIVQQKEKKLSMLSN